MHVLALNEKTKAERQRELAIAQIRVARRKFTEGLEILDKLEKDLRTDYAPTPTQSTNTPKRS